MQAWYRHRSVVVCLEPRVFLVNLGGWSATMFWLFNSLDGCLLSCSLDGYCIPVYYYIWLLWGFQGHCEGYILGNLGTGYLTHEKKVPQEKSLKFYFGLKHPKMTIPEGAVRLQVPLFLGQSALLLPQNALLFPELLFYFPEVIVCSGVSTPLINTPLFFAKSPL